MSRTSNNRVGHHRAPIVAVALTLLTTLWTPTVSAGKIRVVATTSDVASVIQAVGGDRIEVKTLAKGYFDPHHLEARPSYMVAMRKADVLAYNGLQLEVGWLPLLIQGARNRKIVVGADGHLPMSHGLTILEIPEESVSRAHGDVHPEGNPHYTLHPDNLVLMARNAARTLSQVDPHGAAEYAAALTSFETRMAQARPVWEERMRPFRGRQIICYHKHWEYLLQWLGLEVVEYVEKKPGIPPSPKHVEALARTIAERRIPVLLASTFINTNIIEKLAQRTGTTLLILPPAVQATDEVSDSFVLFDHLTQELAKAFSAAQP